MPSHNRFHPWHILRLNNDVHDVASPVVTHSSSLWTRSLRIEVYLIRTSCSFNTSRSDAFGLWPTRHIPTFVTGNARWTPGDCPSGHGVGGNKVKRQRIVRICSKDGEKMVTGHGVDMVNNLLYHLLRERVRGNQLGR